MALAYYLAGRIGLELAYLDGAVAALWPPAGLGLAILFLFGVRLWPGIVIGDLLLADFSTPLGTVLAQTVGNTVALVVAALLLRRLTRGRGSLERVTDVLAFVACALVAALVSAAFGPLALRLGDVIAARRARARLPDLDARRRGRRAGGGAGDPDVGEHRARRASAGASSLEGAVVLSCSWLLATLPPQRDVPYIVFPVAAVGGDPLRAARRRGGDLRRLLRSPSGTRPRTTGRSCATRSRTACSRRSSSSRSRRSRRSCSRR